MTKKRVIMRNIWDVFRLKFDHHLSDRDIGRSVRLGRTTVQNYVKRALSAGLDWPLAPELDDVQLKQLLFRQAEVPPVGAAAEPNWPQIDRELRRKGVMRLLLWEEYRGLQPDGLKYATFNAHYRAWKGTVGLSRRQVHRASSTMPA